MKHYVISKISDCVKIFWIIKSISENAIDSYIIAELLYVLLYWLAASKFGVELVFSRVDVGVLIS